MAMVKEKVALCDTAKSKLKDEFSSLQTEIDSYWHESTKKLDDMDTSYNESQTRLANTEKERIQYYVEKRLLSSRVDGMEIENTIFGRTLRDFQLDYDGSFEKLQEGIWFV